MEADEEQQQQHVVRTHPPAPRLDPWLIYYHGRRRQNQTFFTISEGSSYVKSIPEMRRNDMATCSHGWLVLVGMRSNDCFLLNPVSMEKIQLPPFKSSFCFSICVLSLPPNNPNCIVLFLESTVDKDKIMFCHPGDAEWTRQELETELHIGNAIGYGGKIYGLTAPFEKLVMVDFKATVSIRELAAGRLPRPSLSETWVRNTSIVESGGELFALRKLLLGTNLPRIIREIEVFKVDFTRMVWERVESLGDRAFFWSRSCCTSCSAKECGVKENTIYFTEPDDGSLYAFDLEDESISISLPCPNVKTHWMQPEWVLPLV